MKLLIVLHETVVNCETLLLYHQSPNFKASYHICIARDGTIVYLVPANMKAYAATNSRFINSAGEVEQINGSVDDFAYHIALESPEDGRDSSLLNHSGYTIEQYKSLAWLINQTGVSVTRVVKHDQIRLSESLIKDPRTFNQVKFEQLLKIKTTSSIDKGKIDFGILNTI